MGTGGEGARRRLILDHTAEEGVEEVIVETKLDQLVLRAWVML